MALNEGIGMHILFLAGFLCKRGDSDASGWRLALKPEKCLALDQAEIEEPSLQDATGSISTK